MDCGDHSSSAPHLIQIIIGLSFLQVQRALLLWRKTCQHLVEDVVVPLRFGLRTNKHTDTRRRRQPQVWVETQTDA